MNLLASINGEALSVPGLTIYGEITYGCSAIIARDKRGAAELWCDIKRTLGGIELHSPVDWGRHNAGRGPSYAHCDVLEGPCWSDGSLSAWDDVFLPLIKAADSEGVLRELADWHAHHFGGVE